MELNESYDWIIIGSGFGGSVSALRLAEKGYSVLVIEKGKKYENSDFPKTNWNVRKWFWIPGIKLFGIQKLSFFRHITILSGVGVGGGSLVYANTLPKPKSAFFNKGSWANLENWEPELAPFYDIAWKMLGGAVNPLLAQSDLALQEHGMFFANNSWCLLW
jgi:cholesterol oxidase